MCNICRKKELVDPISVAYVITLFLQTNESCNASGIDCTFQRSSKNVCYQMRCWQECRFSCWKTDAVYPSKQAWTRESCAASVENAYFVLQFPNCQVHLDISAISTKSKRLGFFSKTNLRCRQNAAGTKSARQQTISKMTHMTCSSHWPENGWNLNDQELNYQRHCLFW